MQSKAQHYKNETRQLRQVISRLQSEMEYVIKEKRGLEAELAKASSVRRSTLIQPYNNRLNDNSTISVRDDLFPREQAQMDQILMLKDNFI